MKTERHGTIDVRLIVDISDEPPIRLWRRVLWCITRAPGSPNFELHRWDHDHITREYHESTAKLLAAGIVTARALVPVGFVVTEDEGVEGEWYRRDVAKLSRADAGAQPRERMASMPVRTLDATEAA